jgi:sterol desaturase/sphingolipid hydroxylase (fatty acid hydroxylase superfamily)
MMVVLLGGWAMLLFALEHIFPATVWPRDNLRRMTRNLALGVIAAMGSPLIQWGIVTLVGDTAPLFSATQALGFWPGLLLQLLLLDMWTYALHRAYHRVPTMWRLHGPHHFDQHLDVTSALRFHLGEIMLSSLLRLIPVLALGIAPETNLLFGTILTIASMFQHSNLRLLARLERALSTIIVTPSIHWVHHHAVQRDTDSNYASILSVWDRVFGSASPTQRTPDMLIGVEGEMDRPLGTLLLFPFTHRRARGDG